MIKKYFFSRGYDYQLLYSSFSHSLKKYRNIDENGLNKIQTISYSSSFSLRRIFSHIIYAFNVFFFLKKNKSDILYVILPPNILSVMILGVIKKNQKLIVDIIDLWPEALPVKNNSLTALFIFFPALFSKFVRKLLIDRSDFCITESKFFFNKLNLSEKNKSSVIHIKKFQKKSFDITMVSDILSIAYLGNIGNIYDFESLFKILYELSNSKNCHLHVIGDGPRKKWFFENLDDKNISYTYHGASFSEDLKYEVLSKCWFGYNGYHDETEVALSYKSVDYLSFGVPLINSAKSDTHEFVKHNQIGFNFSKSTLTDLIVKLNEIKISEVKRLKYNAFKAFTKFFSGDSLFTEMDKVISDLNIQNK